MKARQRTWVIIAYSLYLMAICSAAAIAAVPERPDAGRTLQTVNQSEIRVPTESQVPVQIEEKRDIAADLPENMKVKVNRLKIIGATAISPEKLPASVQDALGKEHSLAELYQLADQITAYYHSKGFMVARAYLPAQEIIDGTVSLIVVEGKYGQVVINIEANILNGVIQTALGPVCSGVFVKDKVLERSMLLLNDIPGITAKAILTPGREPGTTDLIVTVDKTTAISGNFTVNNYGNRYTGSNEAGAAVHINNISKQGDDLSLYGVSSGSGMNDWQFSYMIPAGQGIYFGISRANIDYELGDIFAGTDSYGSARTTNVFMRYAFLRSRRANLYGQLSYDHKQLQDHIGGQPMNDKRSRAWTAAVFGDSRDQWLGGGVNMYSMNYSKGSLSVQNDYYSEINRLTAKTAGNYEKWNLNLARLQYISHSLSLYTAFRGQLTPSNLDSSEKMSLGGPYGVRAYPQGEASGDQGYLVNIELRRKLPSPAWLQGDLQLVGFYDTGDVDINKNTWPGYVGDNHRSLAGAGIGLVCSRPDDYSVRINYAWKVGKAEAESERDKNGRVWVQGIKYF